MRKKKIEISLKFVKFQIPNTLRFMVRALYGLHDIPKPLKYVIESKLSLSYPSFRNVKFHMVKTKF